MISSISLASVTSQAALQDFMGVSIGFIHEKKKRNKGDHSPSNLSDYIRMSLSVVPTQESRWTPGLRDLSGKKHWQPDKSQASFYANPGVETKNWKGQNTLSTAFEWQQRGCFPSNRPEESPQAELPSSSCPEREEGNSSAGTELSWQEPEPVSASAGYQFFGQ